MKWNPILTSEERDRQLLRTVLIGGSPLVLGSFVLFAKEASATAGQFIVGVLIAVLMAMLMLVIGLVQRRPLTRS